MAWVESGLVSVGLVLALMGLTRRFREWVVSDVRRCGQWMSRLF